MVFFGFFLGFEPTISSPSAAKTSGGAVTKERKKGRKPGSAWLKGTPADGL